MSPARTSTVLKRLLVANRGEIARRIFRSAHAMGIATVAVYSDADAGAPHVHEADTAVRLPGNTPAETYLRGEALCKTSGGNLDLGNIQGNVEARTSGGDVKLSAIVPARWPSPGPAVQRSRPLARPRQLARRNPRSSSASSRRKSSSRRRLLRPMQVGRRRVRRRHHGRGRAMR